MVLDPEWQLKLEDSLSHAGELREEKLYQLKFKWLGLKV
tara:strand:- start:19 stop:135 length:117 start_codon:yes stop_codon:yes gene_type:complete